MKKDTPEDIVNQIQEACKLLGWNIALNESAEGVKGLVIGQAEYVNEVVAQLDDMDDYTMYEPDIEIDSDLH
jgi:predicted sulfurtransferase